MQWHKLGHIFVANGQSEWMNTHASNPVLWRFNGSVGRIFFSSRDTESRSHIAFVDVDFDDKFKVVNISSNPVLSPGEPGLFDDSGVVMGSFLEKGNECYLYYLGWNLKVTVPWLNTIGVARYNSQTDTFEKMSRAPMMDRSAEDPFTISYPSVLKDKGIYKMWYGSNLQWGKTQETMQHVIKYAESNDGLIWKRTGKVVVGLEHKNEYALSKPWVIKENGKFKMWYSYRGNGHIKTYRIGYAESSDGLSWVRKDNTVGIDVSPDGWDSEMISYPCVFDWRGNRYMLYNGNHYGSEGFGVAVFR